MSFKEKFISYLKQAYTINQFLTILICFYITILQNLGIFDSFPKKFDRI